MADRIDAAIEAVIAADQARDTVSPAVTWTFELGAGRRVVTMVPVDLTPGELLGVVSVITGPAYLSLLVEREPGRGILVPSRPTILRPD